ncbi:MAG: TonB-dependent receptor, partial [Methylotenera sp.]
MHLYPAYPNYLDICPNGNCNGVPTGYRKPDLTRILNKPATEKYSYYSLNPSLGATWQASPQLNIFGNVAQGTRTPSVVELGCALGRRKNPDGSESVYGPGRTCSLPSALSGDPYLPQIKATTYDIGLRGTVNKALGLDNVEWNLGAYRTDLRDDIYLVSLAPGRDFFDTIGDTRRQGIEAGFGGALGKARFKLNYALTDATFEETFKMASADNSSGVQAISGDDVGYIITVKDGSRMPGVSLHNLNANVSYELTPKWTVGLTAVAHSESFLRGNENNEHKKGVAREVHYSITDPATGISQNFTTTRQPTNNPGKVPG